LRSKKGHSVCLTDTVRGAWARRVVSGLGQTEAPDLAGVDEIFDRAGDASPTYGFRKIRGSPQARA